MKLFVPSNGEHWIELSLRFDPYPPLQYASELVFEIAVFPHPVAKYDLIVKSNLMQYTCPPKVGAFKQATVPHSQLHSNQIDNTVGAEVLKFESTNLLAICQDGRSGEGL